MRPLTLRMSGLRSYRSEVTIDFGDPGLIAIVGDTGSGKSSILEAIFFALYGGCTWDHRATAPLISDGASLMQAELVFLAEGRRWRVFRSASRISAQNRHQLECLDDPAVRFDNDGPVTAEIKRLIGLDQNAFLRTVILPQGQFQLLLQATRAERTAILKGIFRLDQLAEAREQADRAARRLRPGVDSLKLERAALLPDPEAALAAARERHGQAETRLTNLQKLSETITAATRRRDDAAAQSGEIEKGVAQVRGTMMPDADTELARLSDMATQLQERRRQLETDREQRRSHADSLTGILTRADRQGEGIEALASAASTLQSLAEQLPSIHDEQAGCEREGADLEDLSAAIASGQDEAQALEVRASTAQAEADRLAALTVGANKALTDARSCLDTARRLAAACAERQREAREADERKSRAAAAVEPAAVRARAAADETKAANSALEAVQRAHAAAHAAEGSQPGAPCPVCKRPLPADFVMPRPPGEAEALTKLTEARRAADQATKAHATAEADLRNASAELERAGQAAALAAATLNDALSELQRVIPGADLGADDDSLLASLATAAGTAAEAHKKQGDISQQLVRQADLAAAGIEARSREFSQRSARLAQRQESVRDRKASCEKAARELPAGYRVNVPLTTDGATDASERVARRRTELGDISEQLAAAHQAIEQIGRDLEALDRQDQEQVDRPARQLVLKLSVAEQRLSDLADILRTSRPAARTGGGLSRDAEWAHELKTATDATLARAQAVLTTLEQRQANANVAISEALAAGEAADMQGLQQAIIDVTADRRRAADDIRTATEQIPRVAELARKILQGEGLIEALDELTRLLADGKFIAYVVTRKQQTLLAIATELLGSMTGNRYGFSEGFEIVDRLTGLPRGVKTLSGGETFLASLALALGLVELAGRGGGRLDALFLDEGFGSLDANSLSEALDALGRQAEAGRMVAIISHLRSVAEAMDRVLAVTGGPSGSQVRWLGGEERDELITEDIEASLLT
ncbi:MAG TPA: SMC family ATPase [Trebonia sp.]|nr:SMC family ATPase [Trebonia sp.]